MEIKQLQHFSKIADLGSLTRAAATLGLTQAALSRQVAVLETELGTELFRRNGRGLVLTNAGKRLLEHAHLILRQVAQAERAVKGTNGALKGTLALGLPPSLARTMVVPLVEAFQKELPEATMRSVDGLSSNLVELVASGKLDCAVVYNSTSSEAVDLLPLTEEPLCLVSGPMKPPDGLSLGAAVTLLELSRLPLIVAGQQNAVHTALASALAALGKAPIVAHEIANMTAILDLVRKGHGYSVIPLSGIHSCVGDAVLRLHRVHRPALFCTLSMAMPAQSASDPLTEGAMQLLRRVIVGQLKLFQADVEAEIDRYQPPAAKTTAARKKAAT